MYQIIKSPLILASTSPRRVEMLKGCGLEFTQYKPDCDETAQPDETPRDLVRRLAEAKARSVASKNTSHFVIGADTVVFIENEILGKPEDEEDAFRMLSRIQGTVHTVWGAFAVLHEAEKIVKVMESESIVKIRSMDSRMIRTYIATGEPMDKAGSYAIQGIGASLVDSVRGSYTNVVGLDLARLIETLLAVGAIG